MASISWTDDIGAATLDNAKPAPADRFTQWEPQSPFIGPAAAALGTGQRYRFPFRQQRRATFKMTQIPNASMDLMLRLQAHLDNGGTVTVTTGDAGFREYATCCLTADAKAPTIQLSDRQALEYTMSFDLENVAASPVNMLCIY